MPEYLALVHYHSKDDSESGPPPDADEVTAAFMRMERSGIAQVLH